MAAAVTLGEVGYIEDLTSLHLLLNAGHEMARAAAVQGISRIFERHSPEHSGEILIQALLDNNIAVRDYARESLLGHSWLEKWIERASGFTQQQRLAYLAGNVQVLLRASHLSKDEKSFSLRSLCEEGPLISSALIEALQGVIQEIVGQIETNRIAMKGISRDPGSGFGMQVQYRQIKEQKKVLKFLESMLQEIQLRKEGQHGQREGT